MSTIVTCKFNCRMYNTIEICDLSKRNYWYRKNHHKSGQRIWHWSVRQCSMHKKLMIEMQQAEALKKREKPKGLKHSKNKKQLSMTWACLSLFAQLARKSLAIKAHINILLKLGVTHLLTVQTSFTVPLASKKT